MDTQEPQPDADYRKELEIQESSAWILRTRMINNFICDDGSPVDIARLSDEALEMIMCYLDYELEYENIPWKYLYKEVAIDVKDAFRDELRLKVRRKKRDQ